MTPLPYVIPCVQPPTPEPPTSVRHCFMHFGLDWLLGPHTFLIGILNFFPLHLLASLQMLVLHRHLQIFHLREKCRLHFSIFADMAQHVCLPGWPRQPRQPYLIPLAPPASYQHQLCSHSPFPSFFFLHPSALHLTRHQSRSPTPTSPPCHDG